MPRSRYATSAWRPSAASPSSASANGAATKRVRQGTSSANAAKRAPEAGSRSTAISSPSGPRRSATRRAWPPAPKVPSTATSPGRGSRSSSSSGASTGTWSRAISPSMAQCGGDARDVVGEGGVVVGPAAAVPDLQAVVRAGHHDLLAEPAVLEQEAREHDAAGAVELGVVGVGGEEALELLGLRGDGVHPLQRGLGVGVVRGRRPDRDAGIDALRED